MNALVRKLRWLMRRSDKRAELREELQFHLDEEADRRRDAGMTGLEATRAARHDLGNVTLVEEDTRAAWGWRRLEQFVHDAGHGLRQVRRNPSFAIVAIATLALGIGGITAMFSAFDAILMRPLPYADASRLVVIWDELSRERIPKHFPTPAELLEWRRLNTVFADIGATQSAAATLSGGAEPEQVPARLATASLWNVLGVTPVLGRVFTQAEDDQRVRVAMISYGLWQRRYGGSPDIVGRHIVVSDNTYEVVGVMPREFYFLPAPDIDIWMPASFPDWMRHNFSWHNAQVVARLKAGVSLEQARDSMIALSMQVTAKDERGPHRVILTPLRDEMTGKTHTALVVLLFASAGLLLIACVNLANLLMSRGAARGREAAVRTALGAGRGRLVAQLLTENLVLAGLGALAGLALAVPALRFLQTLVPAAMGPVRLAIDWRVLSFCSIMAVSATLLFGLVPALRGSRLAPNDSLREGGRGTSGARSHWFQHALIVVETTLAVALLTSGGVLLASFQRLVGTDLGMRSDHVLTFETPLFRYPQLDRRTDFVNTMMEKIQAIPGVVSAGACNELPLRTNDAVATFYWLNGQSRDEIPGQVALMRVVTRGYLPTIGARLREGRFFDGNDRRSDAPVAIVNETFANRHFPGRSALGERFKYGQLDDKGYWYTIVGVVKEIREVAMTEEPRPTVYRVQEQSDQVGIQPSSVVVRTTGEPASIAPAIRETIWSLDRNQPIWLMSPLDDIVGRQFSTPRQSATLMSAIALLALLLASLGLYGVLSYSVTQRTNEIGVRMALGATSSRIVRSVVSRGVALTIAGMAIGLVLAVVMTDLMTPLLYGATANYLPAVTATCLLLIAVATIACAVPARRASRIDPVIALRNE
jgi:putative ABC transport system permease protein